MGMQQEEPPAPFLLQCVFVQCTNKLSLCEIDMAMKKHECEIDMARKNIPEKENTMSSGFSVYGMNDCRTVFNCGLTLLPPCMKA